MMDATKNPELVLVKITTHNNKGEHKPALLAQCGRCGSEQFVVFQIEGQDHIHLQCGDCGYTYCESGKCDASTKVDEA